MNNIFQNYPYTNFHEMNLDFIMDLCAKSLGLHLVWSDKDTLMLCAADGTTISDITINRSNKAVKDDDGNVITSYYVHAVGAENDAIVITYGNGTRQVITVPYAKKAQTDVNGKELTSYVAKVAFQNDALVVYDGTGAEIYRAFTPYAIRALNDNEDHKIDQHYVHKFTATVGEDDLTVYDGNDLEMFKVTVDFATRALNDYTGNAIRQHYVHDSKTDTKQEDGKIYFTNAEGDVIAQYVVGYAQMSKYDVTGEEFRDEYAHDLQPDTKTITLYNDKGVGLSTITVPYATMAEYIQDGVTRIDSAVADIVVDGKELAISYLDKTGKKITVNYAIHAEQDMLDNLITATYVSKVYNNTETGELVFYAANGDVIAQLRPVVTSAVNDNTGKKITSYVHDVTVAEDSKYVTITHGDGVVELIEVPYATKALEDTYGNVIGNDYAFSLDTIVDETIKPEVGSNVIKVVNGEGQEIRRLVINNVQYAKTCGKVIDMKIDDLIDVDTTDVTDGQVLKYDASDSTWKPGTVTSGTGSSRRVTIDKNELKVLNPGTEMAADYLPIIYNMSSLTSKTLVHHFYHKTYDRMPGYGEARCQLYTEFDCATDNTSMTIDDFLGYAEFGPAVPGAKVADIIEQSVRKVNMNYPTGNAHDTETGLWTINDMESLTAGASPYANNYYQVPDDCTKIQYDANGVPTNIGPMPVNCNLCVAVYDLSDNSLVFLRAGVPLLKMPAYQDTMIFGTTVLMGTAYQTTLPASFKLCIGLCYTGPYCISYELVNEIPELVFPSDSGDDSGDGSGDDSGETPISYGFSNDSVASSDDYNTLVSALNDAYKVTPLSFSFATIYSNPAFSTLSLDGTYMADISISDKTADNPDTLEYKQVSSHHIEIEFDSVLTKPGTYTDFTSVIIGDSMTNAEVDGVIWYAGHFPVTISKVVIGEADGKYTADIYINVNGVEYKLYSLS